MYDDILLPVAPESEADHAIPHAASLAERYDATVHVIAATDTLDDALQGPRVATLAERVETAAKERIETVTEQLESHGVSVEAHAVHGSAHEAIIESIESKGIDLVVMATHRRKGLSRFLLGSVTEKIVRTAPVPVLTVPMTD